MERARRTCVKRADMIICGYSLLRQAYVAVPLAPRGPGNGPDLAD